MNTILIVYIVLTHFETNNKYVVKNSFGQKVFYAAENSSCCARCCCTNMRNFKMSILDNFGNEVIHIRRPLACQDCCFPCCLQVNDEQVIPQNDKRCLLAKTLCINIPHSGNGGFLTSRKRDWKYPAKVEHNWTSPL